MAIAFKGAAEYDSATNQRFHTITLPTNANGDLVIIHLQGTGAGSLNWETTPSVWTELVPDTGSGGTAGKARRQRLQDPRQCHERPAEGLGHHRREVQQGRSVLQESHRIPDGLGEAARFLRVEKLAELRRCLRALLRQAVKTGVTQKL